MRILTNLSKAELNQLTTQPTAKAMIQKVKSEGIYIPQGDAKAAAQFVSQRQSEKRSDSFEISDKGLAALNNSRPITSKGVRFEKTENGYNIQFKNPAYAYSAVKNGYIDVGGERVTLSDDDKTALRKAADNAFNQMQQDTMAATLEHNAHVLEQQAEALRSEGNDMWALLEKLLNDEEEEWKSPLLRLENRSVSMSVEKTQEGFSVKEINITKG